MSRASLKSTKEMPKSAKRILLKRADVNVLIRNKLYKKIKEMRRYHTHVNTTLF